MVVTQLANGMYIIMHRIDVVVISQDWHIVRQTKGVTLVLFIQ